VHLDRARTGVVDWAALRTLYAALVLVAPSLGARVALAAVTGRVDGAAAGLAALEDVAAAAGAAVDGFQPFHAVRADLLDRAGRPAAAAAAAAFDVAAALAGDPAAREHLRGRASRARERGAAQR
jgi:RNA polymerase sigma-70 factor (ECF subfamily)